MTESATERVVANDQNKQVVENLILTSLIKANGASMGDHLVNLVRAEINMRAEDIVALINELIQRELIVCEEIRLRTISNHGQFIQIPVPYLRLLIKF